MEGFEPPETGEAITLDANCCIARALSLGHVNGKMVQDFLSEPLRRFFDRCVSRGLDVGYFPLTREESYRNLVKAVNDRAGAAGVRNRYTIMQFKDRAKGNLDRLFSRMSLFPYAVTEREFLEARQFFIDNEVDLYARTGVRKPDNLPDDNDVRLLVATHNLGRHGYIVTDDCDLYGYAEEIEASKYDVSVVAARELNRILAVWRW